jgi:hypothetical protein
MTHPLFLPAHPQFINNEWSLKGNDQDLINYLYEALTTIEARFANCGIIILGDFNIIN